MEPFRGNPDRPGTSNPDPARSARLVTASSIIERAARILAETGQVMALAFSGGMLWLAAQDWLQHGQLVTSTRVVPFWTSVWMTLVFLMATVGNAVALFADRRR
jgi:hypothetical protein